MVWAVPQYSRERVNEAGRALVNGIPKFLPPYDDVHKHSENLNVYGGHLNVVNNWRASHSYALNTFQATLRKRAGKISRNSTFATRIKRLESIERKLRKHEDMKLTQMQDIGGLRVILPTLKNVNDLIEKYDTMKLTHEQAKRRDYVSFPKYDGYRSFHLIYRYKGKIAAYDDLKLEIQIRTELQHAWATAVETVGIFTRQALKSSEGDEEWLRFFALASSVLAEREGTSPVPCAPSDTRVRDAELRDLAARLNVRELLQTYQGMLRALERHSTRDAKFFLLAVEPEEGRISARGFLTRDSITANVQYTELEKRFANQTGAQAVLVKVDSVSALRRAYPNYFADTTKFIQAINEYLPDNQKAENKARSRRAAY